MIITSLMSEIRLHAPNTQVQCIVAFIVSCKHSLPKVLHTGTIQRRSGSAFEPLRRRQRVKAPEKEMLLWVPNIDINICMHNG